MTDFRNRPRAAGPIHGTGLPCISKLGGNILPLTLFGQVVAFAKPCIQPVRNLRQRANLAAHKVRGPDLGKSAVPG